MSELLLLLLVIDAPVLLVVMLLMVVVLLVFHSHYIGLGHWNRNWHVHLHQFLFDLNAIL